MERYFHGPEKEGPFSVKVNKSNMIIDHLLKKIISSLCIAGTISCNDNGPKRYSIDLIQIHLAV